MTKIKDKFNSVNMTWVKVILLAIACAVVTAGLKLIPQLDDTSLQDPAINLEFWFLPAVFIIVNCKKWWEASLKTFVFFLVSQPLIYLIQVPFSTMGFGLFDYYKHWLVITFLTLPGAVVAFLLKKKNRLSVASLSVATGFFGYMASEYFWQIFYDFPRHLLSFLFCIGLTAFFAFVLLDERKHRLTVLGVAVVAFVAALIFTKPIEASIVDLPEGNWSYTVSDDSVIDVYEFEDGDYSYVIEAKSEGISFVVFTNEKGEQKEYGATVTSGGIFVDEVTE